MEKKYLKVTSIYLLVFGVILIVFGLFYGGISISTYLEMIAAHSGMTTSYDGIDSMIFALFSFALGAFILGVLYLVMGILGLKYKKGSEKVKKIKVVGGMGVAFSLLAFVISFPSIAWFVKIWFLCSIIATVVYYYGVK